MKWRIHRPLFQTRKAYYQEKQILKFLDWPSSNSMRNVGAWPGPLYRWDHQEFNWRLNSLHRTRMRIQNRFIEDVFPDLD